VAVVAARPGTAPTAEALVAEAAEHVARYKLPKAVVFVDDVPRSPSGKPDYAAARLLAGDEP
jgi:acyl-CoA synthetase (AMP-forming)/AMP-acid ligase II